MANKTYYFDMTPAAAGFGTLTGTWNTTTANWTESSAGASGTNIAVTFDATDTAQFGSNSGTSTAGTVTVAETATVNKIVTQNVAGRITLTRSGSATIIFAGTNPTLDLQSAGVMDVYVPFGGTAGFACTNSAGGTTWREIGFYGGTYPIQTTNGPISSANYQWLYVNNPTWAFPNARNFIIEGGWRWSAEVTGGFTTAINIPEGTVFSGNGVLEHIFASSNLVTYPAGALIGMTGTRDPTTLVTTNVPASGLSLYCASSYATARQSYVAVNDLPYRVAFSANTAVNTPLTMRVFYIGAGASYPNTRIDLVLRASFYPATVTQEIYANNSDSNPLIIGGGVRRWGVSAAQTLVLRGSSTANNTLGGAITELGALAIRKEDAGKWVLSGSSSYTGVTTVNAGTLGATSTLALGGNGAVTLAAGSSQLELSGGITLNKASSAFTIHGNNPIQSVGDNTLQTGGITLGGTTTFTITTGNRLVIANTGAITDGASTFGITKAGGGELALAAFTNTYDGAVTVSAGTLAIGSVGALGTGVATVQVTGNLKYTGAAATLSRATQLNGASPSLEASGTGALTVSNLSQDVATKTVTLKGTNTDANTITSGLSNNSGILSLVKEGTGEWVLSGARSYTGTTTVSEGTLRLESTNSATTSGAVTIATGSTVELITNTLASSGAGAGEVLGTSNVTCNGGTIKTRSGALQKAQVRYGGNLTLGAGTMYYIGAAA